MLDTPLGGTFWFQIFIQAPSPEICRKTISGGEEGCWRGKWGGLFWATSLEEIIGGVIAIISFRQEEDAAVCRAEVCYPFGREHGRHRAMKRRKFITLLGGAAAWPLAGRAQPSGRMRRSGILMHLASDDADAQSRNAAFLQGLQELGWAVGRNVRIDYRWGASNFDLSACAKAQWNWLRLRQMWY